MLQCENLINKYSVSCEVAGQIQNEKKTMLMPARWCTGKNSLALHRYVRT